MWVFVYFQIVKNVTVHFWRSRIKNGWKHRTEVKNCKKWKVRSCKTSYDIMEVEERLYANWSPNLALNIIIFTFSEHL